MSDIILISDEASPAVQDMLKKMFGERLRVVVDWESYPVHCPNCGIAILGSRCWHCDCPDDEQIPF